MINIKETAKKKPLLFVIPFLRLGKPRENRPFDGAKLSYKNHFQLFIEINLTGIISIFSNSNTIFVAKKQAQINGMAVLMTYQKKGIGETLIKHVENHCLYKQIDLIWFTTRTAAVPFYKNIGYQTVGIPFKKRGRRTLFNA